MVLLMCSCLTLRALAWHAQDSELEPQHRGKKERKNECVNKVIVPLAINIGPYQMYQTLKKKKKRINGVTKSVWEKMGCHGDEGEAGKGKMQEGTEHC